MALVKASHRFARIAATKVRPFADLIRGRTTEDALNSLRYLPNRGARFLEIFYLASLVSYYTCYLIRRFRLTVGTRRLTFSAFSARSPSVS